MALKIQTSLFALKNLRWTSMSYSRIKLDRHSRSKQLFLSILVRLIIIKNYFSILSSLLFKSITLSHNSKFHNSLRWSSGLSFFYESSLLLIKNSLYGLNNNSFIRRIPELTFFDKIPTLSYFRISKRVTKKKGLVLHGLNHISLAPTFHSAYRWTVRLRRRSFRATVYHTIISYLSKRAWVVSKPPKFFLRKGNRLNKFRFKRLFKHVKSSRNVFTKFNQNHVTLKTFPNEYYMIAFFTKTLTLQFLRRITKSIRKARRKLIKRKKIIIPHFHFIMFPTWDLLKKQINRFFLTHEFFKKSLSKLIYFPRQLTLWYSSIAPIIPLKNTSHFFGKTTKQVTSSIFEEHLLRLQYIHLYMQVKFTPISERYASSYFTNIVNKFFAYQLNALIITAILFDVYKKLTFSELVALRDFAARLILFSSQFSTIFFLGEFIDVIYFSLKLKNLTVIFDYVQRILKKLVIWDHKKFLFFFFNLYREQMYPLFDFLEIYGLRIMIKGKVGVGGNSRKRSIVLILGSTTTTATYTNIYTMNRLLTTSTGALGFRVWLLYK